MDVGVVRPLGRPPVPLRDVGLDETVGMGMGPRNGLGSGLGHLVLQRQLRRLGAVASEPGVRRIGIFRTRHPHGADAVRLRAHEPLRRHERFLRADRSGEERDDLPADDSGHALLRVRRHRPEQRDPGRQDSAGSRHADPDPQHPGCEDRSAARDRNDSRGRAAGLDRRAADVEGAAGIGRTGAPTGGNERINRGPATGRVYQPPAAAPAAPPAPQPAPETYRGRPATSNQPGNRGRGHRRPEAGPQAAPQQAPQPQAAPPQQQPPPAVQANPNQPQPVQERGRGKPEKQGKGEKGKKEKKPDQP